MEFTEVPATASVEMLADTATVQQTGDTLGERLVEARALVGDELNWVEAELLGTSSTGAAPGTDAARHLVGQGGKRVRPTAALLSALCFAPISRGAREVAVVAELIHSATLLHDDVIDDGVLRRAAVPARLKWGNAVSVLAGDLLLVHALERTGAHAPAVLGDLVSTLRSLVDGEIIQLRGRSEVDVSEPTYLAILEGKTASLFAWATRSGARVAGASDRECTALAEFGRDLGIAFQLVDDALDYSSEETGKTFAADLREGKITLPLVLAAAEYPSLLEDVQRIHAGDAAPVAQVYELVRGSTACAATRSRARAATKSAKASLAKLPESAARSLLASVADALVDRVS